MDRESLFALLRARGGFGFERDATMMVFTGK
jgi:hypothetical protein